MKDISTALVRMFEEEKQIGKNWEMIVDTLFTELLYLKPIEGEMQRRDNVKKALFKDECEWRYIPNTPKGFPVILPDEYNNEKGREKFTKALIKQKDTWFSFDVDNIEYIIVPNVQAANEIISKVSGMRKNRIIKNKLISKIEIMDKIQQNIV